MRPMRIDADASAISRPPGRGVVRRFTLVSLVLTVAATTVVIWAMGRVVDGYLLWRAASDVSVQFNRAVLPLVPEEGLVALLDPRASPALAGEARSRLLELPSERVALLAPDGGLVYQSRPSLAPASSAQLRRS
ncbi:MAG: hypothetical protein HYY04_04745, partial [Chloroflexi bacterium]|nr:hypothetical protein [Chloroflexota bacterium]